MLFMVESDLASGCGVSAIPGCSELVPLAAVLVVLRQSLAALMVLATQCRVPSARSPGPYVVW